MRKRVVITGIGVISPNGIGAVAFADACLAGRSGLSRPDPAIVVKLKTASVGAVCDFNALDHMDAIDARRVPPGIAARGTEAAHAFAPPAAAGPDLATDPTRRPAAASAVHRKNRGNAMSTRKTMLSAAALALGLAASPANAGMTSRASLTNAGLQANGSSTSSVSRALSANGRYVAFHSAATNLVVGDNNGAVFAAFGGECSRTQHG